MIAIYCRISQDRTGEERGVERQLKDCRALAKRLGLKVDHVYTDNDISATNGRMRPEFEAMLKARPTAIIAWHQDRLLRLSSDLEKVIKLDIPVYTATAGTLDLSTPAGRAVGRTLAAWATYEGEQKAVRQKAANIQRAEAGVWQFSNRPYGYERINKRVEIVPAEAEIVCEGYRRYLEGESYYAIANDWNEREVPTFKGSWSMARVRSMLRNPAYAGERHFTNGEGRAQVTTGDWEPLIDRDTWSAYLQMRGRRKRAGDWSTRTKHLLSGLVYCGVCGGRMTARPQTSKNKTRTVKTMSLDCMTSWCVSRSMAAVQEYVEAIVLARLKDPALVKQLRSDPDTAPLDTELKDLRARRDDIADLVADGLLDRAKARDKARDLTERIDSLVRRADAMRADSPLTDLALAESIPARWEALPLVTQRQVIQALGLDVRIDKAPRGTKGFHPEYVRIEWLPV